MKVAAMADLHRHTEGQSYQDIFTEVSGHADALVLCGDLTDHGYPEEAELLKQDLQSCTIPVIAVLGNHDVESGEEDTLKRILEEAQVHILDGSSTVVQDVGFAGVKGFGGGFDKYMLTPWGERAVKDFVNVGIEESLLLEKALSRLSTTKKIVLMHYAPIKETIKGEPLEIYPYLGCSRLVSPIKRFEAHVVFHGHAHHGTHAGKTDNGIPVFNVSQEILKKQKAKKAYVVYEL